MKKEIKTVKKRMNYYFEFLTIVFIDIKIMK